MKRTVLFLSALLLTTAAQAMDFSGMDLREIPIPADQVEQAKRAELLRPILINQSELAAMTPSQQTIFFTRAALLTVLRNRFVAAESARERAEDAAANPEAVCAKSFGAGFHYSMSVSRDNPDYTEQRFYVCVKDGPSRRTPYDKRMAQINGLVMHIRYKLRHPLTPWPG